VLGRDREHLAERRVEATGGRAQDCGLAADHLHAVVIDVLMRHEHEISRHTVNRRILELDPAASEPGDIAERVDHNGRRTRSESECGLAVSLNLHAALQVIAGDLVAAKRGRASRLQAPSELALIDVNHPVCQPLHRAVIPVSISRRRC
jgi:hypothetical protein